MEWLGIRKAIDNVGSGSFFSTEKKQEIEISTDSVGRALEALVNPKITDYLGHGADYTNDLLRMKPITDKGKTEHTTQVREKTSLLQETIGSMFKALSGAVRLIQLMDKYNRFVFEINFNRRTTHMFITPSAFTQSMDIEIDGKSKSINVVMCDLVRELNRLTQSPAPEPRPQSQPLSLPVEKKPEAVISIDTVAKTLEALVNSDIRDPLGHGADDTNEWYKIKPITDKGKTEHTKQVDAKRALLHKTIESMSKALSGGVQLAQLMDKYNRFVFHIDFNDKDTYMIITPSTITQSMDIEIDGKSKNINVVMCNLLKALNNLFPQETQKLYEEDGIDSVLSATSVSTPLHQSTKSMTQNSPGYCQSSADAENASLEYYLNQQKVERDTLSPSKHGREIARGDSSHFQNANNSNEQGGSSL